MEKFFAQINSFAEQTLGFAQKAGESLGAYSKLFNPNPQTATTATATPAANPTVGPPAPGTNPAYFAGFDIKLVGLLLVALVVLLAVRK